MDRKVLRDFWLEADRTIPCRMLDGKIAFLIIGPTDSQVAADNWRFGFQVPREQEIRWLQPEQIDRVGNGLIQLRADP